MNRTQILALLASYGRSVLAGGIALYLAGVTTPGELAKALLAGVIPVLIRYINPNDPAFGRVPSVVEVDKAIKVEVKTATAKKPTVKK